MTNSIDWDERARGPRMSKTTGKTIWKYQMPVAEKFVMALPEGAEVIRVEERKKLAPAVQPAPAGFLAGQRAAV